MRGQRSNDYGMRLHEATTHACAIPERLRPRVSLLAGGSPGRIPDNTRLLHVVLDVQHALPEGGRVVRLEAFHAGGEDPDLSFRVTALFVRLWSMAELLTRVSTRLRVDYNCIATPTLQFIRQDRSGALAGDSQ